MDPTFLKNIQERSGTLQENRQSASEANLFQGIACLEKFQQDGFGDLDLLKLACRQLIQAMKANSLDDRPCLALAYTFLLIEDYETAGEYLGLAREIDRNNPLNAALGETMAELKRLPDETEQKIPVLAEIPSTGEAALDYDALYDEVEASIVKQVHALMQQPPPKPSLNPTQVKQLEHLYQQLQNNHQAICRQIAVVDREIDVSELRVKLKPFEASLQRYEKALLASEQLKSLRNELDQELQKIEQASQTADAATDPGDIPVLEQTLESLLDHCDAYADQLDALHTSGVEISAIEPLYNNVLQNVEELRETLEDATERLKQL
ncbi:MAG: hypothetical protein CVV27_14350 [Candidatus Melainabacteria bacterium HGW-Melainabacteria-1]|nr:MAG: hypothetical protein CVV27_14350 [Candidatus Melainabacteria bacterium HGW-Melainabacteria-1]